MTTFLEETVDKILESCNDLGQLCIVLPSVRAGVVVKEEIIKQVQSESTFLPQIIGIESLISDMSGLASLSSSSLIHEFYSVYKEHTLKIGKSDPDTFTEFLGWGQQLVNDFNEIDRYLIPTEEFFNYFGAIKELNHWSQQVDSKLASNFLDFWKSLADFYNKVTTRLKQKGSAYQGLQYRQAVARCEKFLQESGLNYVFVGFNALNAAEQYIFQEFVKQDRAQIFWDVDTYFYSNKKSDTSLFIREYHKNWSIYKNRDWQPTSDSFNTHKDINAVSVSQQVGQAKYVGQLLGRLSAQERSKTAVILGDEALLLPLLNSLPENVGPLNVTMGLPLKQVPDAGFFRAMFNLYQNRNGDRFFYKDILELFSQRWSSILLGEVTTAIEKNIKQNNLLYLSAEDVNSQSNNALLAQIFTRRQPDPLSFLDCMGQLLEHLRTYYIERQGWLDLEYVMKFTTIFQQLEDLQQEFGHIDTLKVLSAFYDILLNQETLDFRGDPYKGLQIMGVLESRVLDFKNVIVTSLNEGILPSGKDQGSNIPFDVKMQYRLPTYREKDAIYAYHFFRLLQRCKSAHLLYNNEPGSVDSAEKSRFLLQLEADKNAKYRYSETTAVAPIEVPRKAIKSIEKNEDILKALRAQAANGFSPSALLLYILNPVDFYYRYVLKIKELDDLEETIAHNTLGTIVHESLENLFKPYRNELLSKDTIKVLQQQAEAMVMQQFDKYYNLKNIAHGQNQLIFQVAKRFVKNLLKMEADVLASGAEVVIKDLELEADITLSGFDFPVRLRGNIDRIDQYNGVTRVVDYKTGKVEAAAMNLKDWDLVFTDYKKGSKLFQVLCYALVMQRSAAATTPFQAGIFSFKNLKSGFLSFKLNKDPEITDAILDDFEEKLKALIGEILDVNRPFVEKESPFS